MMTEGLVKPCLTPSSWSVPRVAARLQCFAVVPQCTRAAGVSGEPRFDEVPGDVGKVLHAHDEHEGVRAGGEGLPVVDGAGLIGVFVSGDERYGRGKTAVRQGDARIGRARDGAGGAGDFLERHARVQQFLGLFLAPTEDVGVAALEPGDDFTSLAFSMMSLLMPSCGSAWFPATLPT